MQQDAGKTESEIDIMLYDFYDQWKLKSEERRQAEIKRQQLIASENQELREKEKERKRKRKNIWMPIVKWTQRIFNVIFTVILLFIVSFLIISGIVYITGDIVINGLVGLALLTLLAGIIFVLYWVISILINYFNTNGNSKAGKIIMTPFKYIGIFFKYIFKGIKEFFVLFIEYFKANKNDYCPGINWDVKEDKK